MKYEGKIVIKGFGVGASMLIPGISGGSIAIILGIYDQLIYALAGFRRDIRHNALFLSLFALGGVGGMLAAARPLMWLFTRYPAPVMYFFMGAAAGSLPMLLKKARLPRFSWTQLLWPLLGVAVVLCLGALPPAIAPGLSAPGALFLLLAGLAGAVAFVLPGVSISYVWLIMGMYHSTMNAIAKLQISYLFPLALGLLIGTLLCARLLEQSLKRYPGASYLTIAGFLVGSLITVFPGLPSGGEWLICPLLGALGLILVIKLL